MPFVIKEIAFFAGLLAVLFGLGAAAWNHQPASVWGVALAMSLAPLVMWVTTISYVHTFELVISLAQKAREQRLGNVHSALRLIEDD